MKGFIEIYQVDSSKATLINVYQIESVVQFSNEVQIVTINRSYAPWRVKESYEEIVNKIKQAMEA